jgi:hypothetical protein
MIVGVIAPNEGGYCLNYTRDCILSFVCVKVFILFVSLLVIIL